MARRAIELNPRFVFAAELHEQRAPVGNRVHLCWARQRRSAVIGGQRRFELTHRLKDLTDGVVPLGALGRLDGGALRRL
jgi:hypothetical protein